MSILELRITAVKGINKELRVNLKGESVLFLGDNGSGKSSIELALRWALTGAGAPNAVPSLDSEAGARTHILAEEEPSVLVRLDDGSEILISTSELKCTGSGQKFREACSLAVPFLRRSELQDLLSVRPVDRFRYFESFLDLGQSDLAKEKIQAACEHHQQLTRQARLENDSAMDRVMATLPAKWKPASAGLKGIEAVLLTAARDLGQIPDTNGEWTTLLERRERIEELSQGSALTARRVKLKNALETIARATQVARDFEAPDLNTLAQERRDLAASTVDGELGALLRHAEVHFETAAREHCPVCGQAVDHEETARRIREGIERLSELRKSEEAEEKALGDWVRFLREIWKDLQAVIQVIVDEAFAVEPEVAPAFEAVSAVLARDLNSQEAIREGVIEAGALALATAVVETGEWCGRSLATVIDELPPPGAEGDLRVLSACIRQVEEERPRGEEAARNASIENRRLEALDSVVQAVRQARQDVAAEILDLIGEHIAAYYHAIHPPNFADEATGPPRIVVQRHGGGTAFVRGSFGGREVRSPEWVYSDGHLDTVGLCLFLALRKYRAQNPDDPRILVLDDVVLSVDLRHARRLIELLGNEFSDHQLIVFTHNGLFADWCSSLLPGLRRIPITSWTLEGGPTLGDYAGCLERLRASLEPGPSKAIAMNMMALMDEFLAEARFVYSLSVPAKQGEQYTLSEIWNPFVKAIKTVAGKIGGPLDQLIVDLDQVRDLPKVRNTLGAHENDFAKEFPLATIREIGEATMRIVEALYCEQCARWAKPIPDRWNPSVLHCRCKALKYVADSLSGGSD